MVSTITGLFLIFSTVTMMVLRALPLVLESVAFCTVCLVVGAILLYFGIAPERANVSVEAKLNVPVSKES